MPRTGVVVVSQWRPLRGGSSAGRYERVVERHAEFRWKRCRPGSDRGGVHGRSTVDAVPEPVASEIVDGTVEVAGHDHRSRSGAGPAHPAEVRPPLVDSLRNRWRRVQGENRGTTRGTNRALFTGQGTVTRGQVEGIYLFRRDETNRVTDADALLDNTDNNDTDPS